MESNVVDIQTSHTFKQLNESENKSVVCNRLPAKKRSSSHRLHSYPDLYYLQKLALFQ